VTSSDKPAGPVSAKAVMIDPESMTVVWMNDAAAQDFSAEGPDAAVGVRVEQAVPLADVLGVPDALRKAADTGETQHVQADLVSTSRGSVTISGSVYRLPHGKLLLLMEHGWQLGTRKDGESSSRRGGRRKR
jgi:hypothetical protein